jgi:hypothetical protein
MHAATIFYVFMGSTYVVSVANKTGFEDGKNGALIEPPPCTVNKRWWSAYDSAYKKGYVLNQYE